MSDAGGGLQIYLPGSLSGLFSSLVDTIRPSQPAPSPSHRPFMQLPHLVVTPFLQWSLVVASLRRSAPLTRSYLRQRCQRASTTVTSTSTSASSGSSRSRCATSTALRSSKVRVGVGVGDRKVGSRGVRSREVGGGKRRVSEAVKWNALPHPELLNSVDSWSSSGQ